MHIFPYSRRAGTRASKLPDYPLEIKKNREALLSEVMLDSRRRYMERFIGKTVEVVAEELHEGSYEGYTREYVRAKIVGDVHQGEIINGIVEDVQDNKIIVRRI